MSQDVSSVGADRAHLMGHTEAMAHLHRPLEVSARCPGPVSLGPSDEEQP